MYDASLNSVDLEKIKSTNLDEKRIDTHFMYRLLRKKVNKIEIPDDEC